ncbi:MAG: transglycosylase SLT domain-containing protein [Trueperaceae bacterium]
MTPLRAGMLSVSLLLAALLAWLWSSYPADPELQQAAFTQPQLPDRYAALELALANGDTTTLFSLAHADDSYRAYLSAMYLASFEELPPATRLAALERGLALRVDDALKRTENLDLLVLQADLALAAGEREKALAAYRAALPDGRALTPFTELEADPYRRAAAFQSAGLQSRALEALGGLAAPSIEAPALRALGRYEEALAAYRRWLAEAPGSETALLGEAWCLFYLGRDEEATAAFTALRADGHYGLGLLANRAGNIDLAVSHLMNTGRADLMWLATGLYEARDRYADSLPLYLRLARGGSAYADDAAYRAYVLANRLGDQAAADEARSLLPHGSFFSLILGGAAAAPDPATAPVGELTVAALDGETGTELATTVAPLALGLHGAGYENAAVGELLFALREAERAGDVLATVEVAELLQSVDEYRQSMRAARELLSRGEDDLRVWRLAYPPAWPLTVVEESALHGVEPALVWAIMRQESAFSPVAISRSGAQGLMQVMPVTWDWIAELRAEEPTDPFAVRENIAYGATYLAWLLRYFGGDEELVIAGYNGGQGYVRRIFESEWVAEDKDEFYREIDKPETREYLQRVYENLAVYRVLYPGLARGEVADAGVAASSAPQGR